MTYLSGLGRRRALLDDEPRSIGDLVSVSGGLGAETVATLYTELAGDGLATATAGRT